MRLKPSPFTRLQWKLTFSYALVTIAVLGLLYITLFTLAFIARNELISGSPALSESPGGFLAVVRLIVREFLSPIPIISIITLGTLIIGTIFGVLVSRGLVRRLGKITGHAASWGGGDFSGRILDHSADEIGKLSRDLDHLAGNLQELILERQRLAALDERNRLRRDLHDSVKQQIFAANMNLATTIRLWDSSPKEARGWLELAVHQVRQAQTELNGLIQPDLEDRSEDQDLKAAIGGYVADWRKQNGIDLDYEPMGEGAISPTIFGALYRVTQEALANVARHSQAHKARLKVELTSQIVTLTISDDGCGFDQAEMRPGMGLRSMQDRVEALGGQFQLTTGDTGTFIQVHIPLVMDKVPGAS